MYSVSVKSHLFIAHSLNHPNFGPAQNLHGATLEIVISLYRKELDDMNVVVDIGYIKSLLDEITKKYSYQNLDLLEEFNDSITSIDYLCGYFFRYLEGKFSKDNLETGPDGICKMKIEIYESLDAWASYENDL